MDGEYLLYKSGFDKLTRYMKGHPYYFFFAIYPKYCYNFRNFNQKNDFKIIYGLFDETQTKFEET